jgi:CheY-like chemotaxis protein
VALFLKDVVEESGWRVDAIAPSCKEALDQAEKHNIQLAFVDVRLKGADDGIATALQLVDRHGIKVIFMSGNPDMGGDERVDVVRPLAILAKPCSPQTIEQVLQKVRLGE